MAAPRESVDNPLRKTPSQTRALRTVDTLFEAAARVLASDGEAGFTTNRVGPHYVWDPVADIFYASTMTKPTFKYVR